MPICLLCAVPISFLYHHDDGPDQVASQLISKVNLKARELKEGRKEGTGPRLSLALSTPTCCNPRN